MTAANDARAVNGAIRSFIDRVRDKALTAPETMTEAERDVWAKIKDDQP